MVELAERRAGDHEMLRSGARFVTAQRAFIAELLCPADLDSRDDATRAFLALQAFEQYMVSGEDTLSWVCALMEWETESASLETCLLAKLDTIQIGGGHGSYTDEKLEQLFERMTPDDLRSALKVERDFTPPVGVTMHEAIFGYWLSGLRRIVRGRRANGRAYVRAYNKAKHGLVGIYGPDVDGHPTVALLTATTGDYTSEPVQMNRAQVRALPRDIRMRVNWTIQMQAVLQSILAFMLGVHFDDWEDTPEWARRAWQSEGWLTSGAELV